MTAPPQIFAGFGYIGIGKQSAQGTPVAPSDFFLFDKESFRQNIGSAMKHTGADQQIAYAIITGSAPSGNINIPLTANTGSEILAWALGGTDTVAGSADPYTHTPVWANDTPWLSIERAFADQQYIERIADCKIGGFQFTAKEKDQAFLNFDFMGCSTAKQASAASVTYDADPPMMFRDAAFTLNTVEYATCVGISITCKRNLKARYTNSVAPSYLIQTVREITVSMDLLFESTNAIAEYNHIIHAGGTSGVTKTPYTGELVVAVDPGASPDHSITFTIPNLAQLDVVAPLNPSGDAQLVTVTGTAIRPSVGGNELAVVGINSTATAYSA